MAEEFNIISTGESPQPSYDESTGKMHDPELNDGAGGKREPSLDETVRAAYLSQRAARDPVEKHRQTLERNGKTLHGLLNEVAEFDNISQRDPVAGIRHITTKFGLNPQAVAQHLWNETSPTGTAAQAEQEHAYRAIAEFDAKYTDDLSKHLRPMAQKLLEKGDKRVQGGGTHLETLEKAFAAAFLDLPQNKARNGPSQILASGRGA